MSNREGVQQLPHMSSRQASSVLLLPTVAVLPGHLHLLPARGVVVPRRHPGPLYLLPACRVAVLSRHPRRIRLLSTASSLLLPYTTLLGGYPPRVVHPYVGRYVVVEEGSPKSMAWHRAPLDAALELVQFKTPGTFRKKTTVIHQHQKQMPWDPYPKTKTLDEITNFQCFA